MITNPQVRVVTWSPRSHHHLSEREATDREPHIRLLSVNANRKRSVVR
jgi:hypothetical protein